MSEKSKRVTHNVPVADLINNFILVKETGFIYEIIQDKKNKGTLFLRKGNAYQKFDRKVIAQRLVDGKYSRPNEHQLKQHIAKEQKYFQELTEKLVHRIVLGQALIECNDDLIEDYADDKYIKNTIEKSNKQLSRLVEDVYARMYNTEPKMLVYCLEELQKTAKIIGKTKPHHFVGINTLLDEFVKNPEKYIPEVVHIKSLGTEAPAQEVVSEA